MPLPPPSGQQPWKAELHLSLEIHNVQLHRRHNPVPLRSHCTLLRAPKSPASLRSAMPCFRKDHPECPCTAMSKHMERQAEEFALNIRQCGHSRMRIESNEEITVFSNAQLSPPRFLVLAVKYSLYYGRPPGSSLQSIAADPGCAR